MFKRLMIIGGGVVTVIVLVVSIALWFFLSSWVPTKGKALVIEEVRRQTPLDLAIGAMRYEFVRGLIVDDLRVFGRTSQQVLAAAPSMQIRVDWIGVLLHRRVNFHSRTPIEIPCQTLLTLGGSYHLRDHTATLDAQTTEIPLSSITAPLTRVIPPALSKGTLQLNVHVRQSADSLIVVTGTLAGTQLVWQTKALRLTADTVVGGSVRPPASANERWMIDANVAMHRGTLDGVPVVDTIRHLEGTAHLTQDTLNIDGLTGTLLETTWKLEGIVPLIPATSMELHTSAHLNLMTVARAFPALTRDWNLEGLSEMSAVCRGPLTPAPMLDCLIHSELQNATVSGKKLTHPITHVNGHLAYDVLTHQVSLETVTGRLTEQPISVDGLFTLTSPAHLGLTLKGPVPLEMMMPWLPASTPISRLGGTAAIDLRVEGTSVAPRYSGTVELNDAALRLTKPVVTVEHLTGSAQVTTTRITIPHATCLIDDQPLTLQGTWLPLEGPRLHATVTFPQGQLSLASHLTPTTLVVDDGTLSLPKSRVTIRGALGRDPERSSTLDASGLVELSELTSVPFLSLPQLKMWEAQGLVNLQGRFKGHLNDWPAAAFRAHLEGDQLTIRKIPIQQLRCHLEQNRGVLRLSIPSAVVAGGKFQSDITLDRRRDPHAYQAQADLLGLQLAQLVDAIPAWKARAVTGTASAHAVAAGLWPDRSTWTGEGWLNASGEHLGNLPLLEKLFRGLFGVLAERFGLETLRRADITQASVRWRLAKERLATDDLRLGGVAGTEPIAMYAKGSVGFDQTLNFIVEPELSEGLVLAAPTTSTLAHTILNAAGQLERFRRLVGRHRLTGTLKEPQYRFEFSVQETLKQLAPAPADLFQNLLDAVR